ncbi:FdtA/QdtA family cupin domain-containing protein [Akkermansiaceae bacterium]|nr:FdtA/QdtA family cupin domain-containing protein [Akkermansiaceae bacterium]
MSVKGISFHVLKRMADHRGVLCAGEVNDGLPFAPKRIFYVYGVPTRKSRGEHAHKGCHQFLICLNGSVSVVLDDGEERAEFELNDPSVGLWIEPGVWAVQHDHHKHTVLLVLASDLYDANDYIRDYDEFLEWKKKIPN